MKILLIIDMNRCYFVLYYINLRPNIMAIFVKVFTSKTFESWKFLLQPNDCIRNRGMLIHEKAYKVIVPAFRVVVTLSTFQMVGGSA